ncbi:MAG TPA: allantoicase [Vicinamibacteria bacterium]|nr:allantoicase [Vicinamibacteria bacterium]
MEFTDLPDLGSARVGGRALFASDDFFAPRNSLVRPEPAVFVPGKYTARGKWMDGWESRRRRDPGHDWCIVRLGLRGVVRGVDIDTSHFNGNQPEAASLEGCDAASAASLRGLARAAWRELVPRSPLAPSAHHLLTAASADPVTHVRLNIFPDGGVARLRVHGEVAVDLERLRERVVDLAAVENGGVVLEASDAHFGRKEHLNLPGRAKSMAEGWETRRRRGPGHDWAILRLGATGRLERVEVDTNHFKGNYPESFSLEARLRPEGDWTEVIPPTRLQPHARHFFSKELRARGPFAFVRLRIYPDGGVSRLRVHGRIL